MHFYSYPIQYFTAYSGGVKISYVTMSL